MFHFFLSFLLELICALFEEQFTLYPAPELEYLLSVVLYDLINSVWSPPAAPPPCQQKQITHVSQQKRILGMFKPHEPFEKYIFFILQLSFTAQVLEFIKTHVS